MRLERSGTARVPYETARDRALVELTRDAPVPASSIAQAIWPDHQMTAQGAGGAASRILRRMERDGLARWTSTGSSWGWVKTGTRA